LWRDRFRVTDAEFLYSLQQISFNALCVNVLHKPVSENSKG